MAWSSRSCSRRLGTVKIKSSNDPIPRRHFPGQKIVRPGLI
jgi:hypothetical protein